MRRTKDLFIEIREKEIEQEEVEKASVFDSGILCPNCFTNNLLEYSSEDLFCSFCTEEFIKTGNNRIKFKKNDN